MKTKSRAVSLGLCALALGTVAAQAAAPTVTDIALVPRLTIQSDVGITNQIQYTSNVSQSTWSVLTNLLVTQSPYYFVDVTAPPAPRRLYRVVSLATNMVPIPAGAFTMGDSLDGDPSALPLHTNLISAFYLDKYEVTKELWDDVYNWAITHGYSFEYGALGKATNHPAQNMTWYDAVKWCNARSESEGRTPAYYTSAGQTIVYRGGQIIVQNDWVKWSAGYRLPTEAEWEKAARGGASGRRFPWPVVDTITWGRANYYANPSGYSYDLNPTSGDNPAFTAGGAPYTSPAGYFATNGYGLSDMAGNVWEWCWDWYEAYSSDPQTNPRGPTTGAYRVLRGGAWDEYAFYCRAANRYLYTPSFRRNFIGFRAVLPQGQ